MSSQAKADAGSMIYAKSLLTLAGQSGGNEMIEQVNSELVAVLELAQNDPLFAEFLSSRIFPAKRRAVSLAKIFEGRISGLTLRFLQVVNRKGRLPYLSSIAAAYSQLMQEAFGRVEVEVFTAQPATQVELDKLHARLSEVLQKQVVLYPRIDERMIGGMKVQIGDQLIDASVSTQLRRLTEQLAEEGGSKVRARINSILSV